jgi:tRNA(Ile)-lysidine synthase
MQIGQKLSGRQKIMIQLATKIPRSACVAVSGGADSMSLLSFCHRGRKNITALHIDHRTDFGKEARKLVETYCHSNSIPLVVKEVTTTEHNEEKWRNERLGFYRDFTSQGLFVCTGHQLDDLIEWLLLTCIHGKPKFMSPVDEEHKLLKPFLLTEKQELVEWCRKFSIPYLEDPTNTGQDNARAKLRGIMPTLLSIHPGLRTSIKNKMKATING